MYTFIRNLKKLYSLDLPEQNKTVKTPASAGIVQSDGIDTQIPLLEWRDIEVIGFNSTSKPVGIYVSGETFHPGVVVLVHIETGVKVFEFESENQHDNLTVAYVKLCKKVAIEAAFNKLVDEV